MIERFWIFTGDGYHPNFGINDLVGVADSFDEAAEVARTQIEIFQESGTYAFIQIVQVIDNRPAWIWDIETHHNQELIINVNHSQFGRAGFSI